MKLQRIHEMVGSDVPAQGSVICAEHFLRDGRADNTLCPVAASVKQQLRTQCSAVRGALAVAATGCKYRLEVCNGIKHTRKPRHQLCGSGCGSRVLLRSADVSNGSFLDIGPFDWHVRYTLNCRHRRVAPACRLGPNSEVALTKVAKEKAAPNSAFKAKSDVTDYRRTPTRLTPPFKLPPALCRTAARATGRGLSTTPARATQPTGYSTYWQYTTALAGAELRVRPVSPNRTLAAIPATVADLIERRFLACMADSSSRLRTERCREPPQVRLNPA